MVKQIQLRLMSVDGSPGSIKESWIPLVEYAFKRGVSLSTLRRYIKSNKVEYRLEGGRYLLKDDIEKPSPPPSIESSQTEQLKQKLKKLEVEFHRARQEIVELKTLIALYEERFPGKLEN